MNGIDKGNRKAEIGYWLGEEAQGNGIITRAVKALIDYGFEHLSLNKVFMRVATGNDKSVAIPRRLKFKEEGILRQNEWRYDHFKDDFIFGLLRSEWEAPKDHP